MVRNECQILLSGALELKYTDQIFDPLHAAFSKLKMPWQGGIVLALHANSSHDLCDPVMIICADILACMCPQT